MPRITSNLESTKAFQTIDDGWAQARISGNPTLEQKSKDKAPCLIFTHELFGNQGEEGTASFTKNNGRKINFDRVVVGGMGKDGEPLSLNRLLMYIGAYGVAYKHVSDSCGAENTSPPVKVGSDFHCPSCNGPLDNIDFESNDFNAKAAMINISSEQQKTRQMVDGVEQFVPQVDDDGRPVKRNIIKQVKAIS